MRLTNAVACFHAGSISPEENHRAGRSSDESRQCAIRQVVPSDRKQPCSVKCVAY